MFLLRCSIQLPFFLGFAKLCVEKCCIVVDDGFREVVCSYAVSEIDGRYFSVLLLVTSWGHFVVSWRESMSLF